MGCDRRQTEHTPAIFKKNNMAKVQKLDYSSLTTESLLKYLDHHQAVESLSQYNQTLSKEHNEAKQHILNIKIELSKRNINPKTGNEFIFNKKEVSENLKNFLDDGFQTLRKWLLKRNVLVQPLERIDDINKEFQDLVYDEFLITNYNKHRFGVLSVNDFILAAEIAVQLQGANHLLKDLSTNSIKDESSFLNEVEPLLRHSIEIGLIKSQINN